MLPRASFETPCTYPRTSALNVASFLHLRNFLPASKLFVILERNVQMQFHISGKEEDTYVTKAYNTYLRYSNVRITEYNAEHTSRTYNIEIAHPVCIIYLHVTIVDDI